jgi:quinol monooxygenase YgiN
MSYRGADLDLRTARTWSATSTDIMGGFEVPAGAPQQSARAPGDRGGPIWVDETLLAAANHAFEVALAHRSGEVRLEHLLHALTRVEAASAALEARGVRVGPLRRDSAVVIASEIPVGLAAGSEAPRRAAKLEDTLRRAAVSAEIAGRPAGVDDVMHVLVDLKSDHPAAELLARNLPRAAREYWSAFGRPSADAAKPERSPNAGQKTGEGGAAAPAALQQMLQRLGEIERVVTGRLAAMESALSGASFGGSPDLQPIKDRLDIIEEAVLSREGDGAVVERLSALARLLQEERAEREDALSSLVADVKALAGALGYSGANGETHHAAFAERVQTLAADLEQHRIELGASLGDRIAAIEQALAAQGEKAAVSHTMYSEELAEVHEALMKLNTNQHTLAGSIEQWRSNDAGEIHLINARIGAVQEDGTKRLQLLERLCMDVEALSRQPREEKSPRRGFRHWLFGTDDWVKASWQKRGKKKG